ncbi:hypothetical protein PI124_g21092 [Phytophthora idaei]|nr:hypothetical protein PI124_g21092 [Phytophthora idaei]
MQGCFSSLLRVRAALRVFKVCHCDDDEFPDELKRDQNTLSDVTFWFQQLYDSFKASSYSETPDGMNGLPVVMADKLGDFALLYYRNNFDADAPSITGEMSEWMNGKMPKKTPWSAFRAV